MNISPEALTNLLGIHPETPLDIDGMCRRLRPVIYPAPHLTERLEGFCSALSSALQSLGIRVPDHKEATGSDGRFPPGTVIFAPGHFPDDLLAINRVSTLYNNIIVGIYDEHPPVGHGSLPQERLDAIVSRLARDMVHILVYVTARSWTICTMNGGVVTFNTPLPSKEDVRNTLVPKISAQVVPPGPDDIDLEYGTLETTTPEFRTIADDFMQCSALWKNNHCLVTHTSTEGLEYRSGFYRRIVARYLDRRSGMSYGFFARQRPLPILPALLEGMALPENLSMTLIKVPLLGRTLLVPVPTVSAITTRSGCRKHQLEPEKDLVEIGLTGGRAWMRTPGNSSGNSDARPSFDTLTILAHALGNAFAASILKTLSPGSPFPGHLERNGATMTHWHDYPPEELLPEGYHRHGHRNPPVSCSTPQSAAYSLMGKIAALEKALAEGKEYRGDVHFEPNHGTNIVGMLSLAVTAAAMNPQA
ncbi:MAG: hypothetical protein HGA70_04030 [Chlorobiaceae bacterium]|nr:hypothetical protein [Chlorobiaceae bacterium]NTW10456.1 hypothetical protein [Chlorobiaceae bacterium]